MDFLNSRCPAAAEAALSSCVEQSDFGNAISACEALELLYVSGVDDNRATDMYSVYLLSLLTRGLVNEARLLWKRIPPALKGEGRGPRRAWAIAEAVAAGTWEEAFRLLREPWPETLLRSVVALRLALSQQRLDALSAAYSNVLIETVVAQCGLSMDDLRAVCETRGWELDVAAKSVRIPVAEVAASEVDVTDIMKNITSCITHFKMEPLKIDSKTIQGAMSETGVGTGAAGF